jgi:hypothetical protein
LTINCTEAAMAVVNNGNSSCHQWMQRLMAVAVMASLPPPLTPMTGWWLWHQLPLHS